MEDNYESHMKRVKTLPSIRGNFSFYLFALTLFVI